jgi:hypothetical protein
MTRGLAMTPGRAFSSFKDDLVSLRASESHIAGMEGSMSVRRGIAAALIVAATAANAAAQDVRGPISGSMEGMLGHAMFADEELIHHSVFGAAAQVRVTERLAVGPELVRMHGPGDDRDWIFAGAAWFDLVSPGPLRAGRAVPFVSGGFGVLAHSDRFGTSNSRYYAGGAGVRLQLTDRFYIAPEVLFASELHLRTVARIGYHIPRSR